MLQPFKSITIVMKGATNEGVTATNAAGNKIVKADKKYYPVTVDTDGLGKVISADTDICFGVLMESFDKTNVPSQVMVQGIVNMKAAEAVTAGTQVAWNFTSEGLIPYTSGKCLVGKALSGATAEGEYVDVLIG